MNSFRKLSGLYLVVAPIMPFSKLLVSVKKAMSTDIDIVQFIPSEESLKTWRFAKRLSILAHQNNVPFLINGNLSIAKKIEADGVHLDSYNIKPKEVRRILGKQCIVGYTLGNDLKRLTWAETMEADYVSFCSVFPTSSVTKCNIVPVETLKAARSMTNMPIFAAGGITHENARLILDAGADGIAVTAAILKAKDPEQAARSFKKIIRKHRKSDS